MLVGRGLLDAPRTSAGRPVSGPYEKEGWLLYTPQGLHIGLPAQPSPFQGEGAPVRTLGRMRVTL